MSAEKTLYTPAEVAAILKLSLATVYALLASGQLKSYPVGTTRRTKRISQAQLDEYLVGPTPTNKPTTPTPPERPKLKHLRI